MKVGIIGCGRIARAHARAIAAMQGAELVGVCDRDRDRTLEIATLAGNAGTYDDAEQMIRELSLDVVHVLTPPSTHAALAIRALELGCHVFVEKPMAMSVSEADAMIAAADKAGRKLCVGHNYLFKPSVSKALDLVASGAIGEIAYINTYYGLAAETGSYATAAGRAQSAWRWEMRGGVFTDFLPHLIYMQLGFITAIDRVAAVTMLPSADSGREPTEMGIQYEGSGVLGSMTISMRAKPYAKFIDVYGTRGIVHADLAREVCVVHREKRMPGALSKILYSLEESGQLALGTVGTGLKVATGRMKSMPELPILVGRFYESIRNDSALPVPMSQGRDTLDVMERVWELLPKQQPEAAPSASAPDLADGPRTPAETEFAASRRGARVFVTGATGFVGQRLIQALARCGADVTAMVRDDKRIPGEIKGAARFVVGDLRDADELTSLMQGCSIVFHTAAITTNAVPWSVHYDTNVLGTENVMRAAAECGVEHVVHTSSVAVYGLDKRPGSVLETDTLARQPDRWAYYIRTKLKAEEKASAIAEQANLDVSIMRLGLLYGPGAARPVGRGLVQLGSWRFVLGSGRNHLPYTFIDNAVDALLLAAARSNPGIEAYNIVDGPPRTVRDAAREDGEVRREKVRLVPVPPVLLSSLARYVEYRNRNTETAPKLTRYVVRSATRDIIYDTRKANDRLGWEPVVDLERGLRLTHDWRA